MGNRRLHSILKLFIVSIFCLILTATAFAQKGLRNGDPDEDSSNPKAASKDNPAARAEWFMRGRTVKGKNSAKLLHGAFQQKLKMRQAAAAKRAALAAGTTDSETMLAANAAVYSVVQPTWVNLGPTPITGMGRIGNASGRITAVAVDQGDSTGNTVYVAGAYGGLWRSTNAAAADPTTVTWTALYDTAPAAATLSANAITIQPTNDNVILVGTGEPNNAIDSYYGMGIMRSVDSGTSWTLITASDGGANSLASLGVAKFAWGTASSDFVVAAMNYTPISGPAQSRTDPGAGMYYSTDAGATWHRSPTAAIYSGRPSDVVWNATLGKFFAAFGRQGYFSSTDGINWTRLTNQPASFTAGCDSSFSCDMMRGVLTVRPGSADTFAWTIGNDGVTNRGISRTLDGGATAWSPLSTAGIDSCGDSFGGCGTGQGFYDLYLGAVNNGTGTDLYAGSINVFKCNIPSGTTTNICGASSGTTNLFLNLTHVYGSCAGGYTTIHPDQHAIDFLHSNPSIIYFGNDGGAYRTLSGTGMTVGTCSSTSNPFSDLNTSSLGSLSQFISISQNPTDSTIILGGTQDNGSPAFAGSDGSTTGTAAYEANGGDGGYNQIDPNTPTLWYTAFTDVSIQKCIGSGAGGFNAVDSCIRTDGFSSIVDNTTVGGDHGAFYTPYILDPGATTKLLVGTCRVWRGNNDGTSFAAISQNFTVGNTSTCTGAEGNQIRSLAAGGTVVSGVSPVIYVGTDSGGSDTAHIWVTTNANLASPTWNDTRANGTSISAYAVAGIAVDRTDATGQTAYITVMGYNGSGNGAGHVYKTTNAGGNWTDVGIGLPDVPVNAVVIDPRDHNIIYVGTDVGVFVSYHGGTWVEYGIRLPNVTVLSMTTFNSGGVAKLRVGTHGRGIWQTDLYPNGDYTLSVSNPTQTVFPNSNISFTGTLTATGSYNSGVNLSCAAGTTNPSTTCTPAVSPVTPTVGGAAFSITSGNTTAGDLAFNIKGTGTDLGTTIHQQAVTLHVIDYQLAAGTNFSVVAGNSGSTTLALSFSSNWPVGRAVNATCSIAGSPTGMTCSMTPTSLSTAGNFTLQVSTSLSTPTGPVNVTVTATDSVNNTHFVSRVVAVTVTAPPPAAITVVTPNGGEAWAAGTSHSINWSYTSLTGNVTIALLKGGVGYKTLGTVPIGTSGTGSYLWSLPATLPVEADYTIRIISVSSPAVLDVSNVAFSVTAAPANTITPLSPAGGESWAMGSTHTIQWNYTGLTGNLNLVLLKAGVGYTTIATVPVGTAGVGSYSWKLPFTLPVSSDFRIRFMSATDSSIVAYSNGNFSVAAGITVNSPNGGESWAAGSNHSITWGFGGVTGNASVVLLKGGVGYKTLATVPLGTSNAGSYLWTLPANLPVEADYTVRVSSVNSSNVLDVSNAAFSVTAHATNTITPLLPAGGETWTVGSTHTIQWNYTGLTGNVTLVLLKAGIGYTTIATVPVGSSGTGSYSWKIPFTIPNSSDYRIRIMSTVDSSAVAYSNGAISIVPGILVTSPNGGESWAMGSTHNIQWGFGGVTGNVTIALLKGGIGYKTIATVPVGSSSAGTYSWVLPTNLLSESDYTIRIMSVTTPSVLDVSNANFTITP